MALVRELIEERKGRKQYPLLAMFCDWSLHPHLDRSTAGADLLDLLDETWANSQQVDQQIQTLVGQLSPQTLRADLTSLLRSALIWPGPLENDGMFRSIVSQFTADLAHKPICRNTKDQPKRIQARLASGYRFAAERIQFEGIDGQLQLVLAARQIDPPSSGEVRIQIPWGLQTLEDVTPPPR
jgi:hypothetical protein